MKIFVKLSSSLAVTLKMFTLSSDKSDQKRIMIIFFGDTPYKLIFYQLCKIQQI